MKISLKQVLAVGALAVASTSAFADIAAPSTGNGELALYVLDVTTGTSYARGLQVNMDNILTGSAIDADVTGGTYTTGKAVPFSLGTVAPDANLTAFLSAAQSAGDTIVWTVAGGDSGNLNTNGAERYALAITNDLSGGTTLTNSNMRTTMSNMNTTVSYTNGQIDGTTLGDGASTSNGVTGYNYQATNLSNNVYSLALDAKVALGSSANFYLLSSVTGVTSSQALVYTLSSLTLSSDGTLSSASAAPVPVPAAFWLLGSGLAGLVGIGRRKQA